MRRVLRGLFSSKNIVNLKSRYPLFLVLILAATALLWSGVIGIGVNSDDYEGLAAAAPIHSSYDLIRPFIVPDPNPYYFRPVSAVTMSADFLLFGWNGPMFHLTSLLTHLIATLLVFYVSRDVFKLTIGEALCTTLAFGIAASHELNLTVDAMRVDVVLAIFVLLTLILEYQARHRRSWLFRFFALLSFIAAVLAKEVAIILPILIPLVLSDPSVKDRFNWKQEVKRLTPYLLAAVVVYIYHAQFTGSPLNSEALSAEGGHSIVAALRNSAYALGYSILPLDLQTATKIIGEYGMAALVTGAVLAAVFVWMLMRGNKDWRSLWKPIFFIILTGGVLAISFERWRIYLPSVGLFALIVLLVNRNRSRTFKGIAIAAFVLLGFFHIFRALNAQAEWRASTALKDKLLPQFSRILDSDKRRPLNLGILLCPAKLGSASVLMPDLGGVIQRVEADRISNRNRQDASIAGVNVDMWGAVNVFALDRKMGYSGLQWKKIDKHEYEVTATTPQLILYPFGSPSNGVARRDFRLQPGMTIRLPEVIDSICEVRSGAASRIRIRILDTAALPIAYLPDSGFVVVR